MVEHFRIPFVIGAGITVPGMAKVAINSSWKDLDLLPGDVTRVRAGEGRGSGMDPKMSERHYKMSRDAARRVLMEIVRRSGYVPRGRQRDPRHSLNGLRVRLGERP